LSQSSVKVIIANINTQESKPGAPSVWSRMKADRRDYAGA